MEQPDAASGDAATPPSRSLERVTGALLLVYGLLVVVSVVTRVLSRSDQEPFPLGMAEIAKHQELYLTSAVASLVSHFCLIALAAGLYLVLRERQHWLALVGTFFLLAAASVWVVSSSASLALLPLSDNYSSDVAVLRAGGFQAPGIELIRELTGRASFNLAALAALTLGGAIAWRRPVSRWLGWLGMVAGVLMCFIWLEDAALLHRLGGVAYLLWLWLLGGWLILRGARGTAEDS